MASYEEIYRLRQEVGYSRRVESAILDVADDVRVEVGGGPEWEARQAWAARVTQYPESQRAGALNGILISNQALSVAEILNLTDEDLKSAVAGLVDMFAGA